MTEKERKKIIQVADQLQAVSEALLMGRIENDTASHWITILLMRIRLRGIRKHGIGYGYAWFDQEWIDLHKFLRQEGLPGVASTRTPEA
jgi:hypothetical protein